MNFFSLVNIEIKKIRRLGIFWILLIPIVILWIPSVINADINFTIAAEGISGISPENNFFVQGFMGFAWFMFPASLVVSTVMLIQSERGNRGILKMLSLPVNAAQLCMAKFTVLLILAAVQMTFMVIMYFPSAAIASHMQNYEFMLPPLIIVKEAVLVYLVSVPMAAVFWMLAVCIETPVFSIGTGLASIVPAVLVMNTKVWFIYPMCYPFLIVTSKMHELASDMGDFPVDLFPWIPMAAAITVLCLAVAGLRFGRKV